MSIALEAAYRYLAAPADGSWTWSADGQVITWCQEPRKTICFQQEIAAVVQRLAPHGLPVFESIVIFMAAWRDDHWRQYAHDFGGGPGWALASAETRLKKLSELTPDLRRGIDACALIAEIFFEGSPRELLEQDAQWVVQLLADGPSPEKLRSTTPWGWPNIRRAVVVKALGAGRELPTEDEIRLRSKTGVETVVEPAEEISPPPTVRQLLANLRNDPEYSALAGLTHDLMAALTVPRALRRNEELPVGGVSDISNRGELDKLLLTELAHDDLTLAVRVATNEALYIRRESPPAQVPQRRALLIDSGIRLWGVPRLFATAAALAFAATAPRDAQVLAYGARKNSIEPLDLTTRAGLVAHLASLEPAPHPGSALKPFADALNTVEETQTDALLITHEDALADPDFTKFLHADDLPQKLVATVNLDGAFKLYLVAGGSRRLLSEAVVSLDAIMRSGESRPPGSSLLELKTDEPWIMSIKPFPLLLPTAIVPNYAAASARHGLVAMIPRGRRLLHWADRNKHASELARDLPTGTVMGIYLHPNERRACLVTKCNEKMHMYATCANLDTGLVEQIDLGTFQSAGPTAAWLGGNILYLIYPDYVKAHNLDADGSIPPLMMPKNMRWISQQFFRGSDGYYALAFDGVAPLLEKVPTIPKGCLALFQRQGHDGPFALLYDGQIIDTDSPLFPLVPALQKFCRLRGISQDGERLAIISDSKIYCADLSLPQSKDWAWKGASGNSWSYRLLGPMANLNQNLTLHRRIDGIVAFNGTLLLRSTKQNCFSLERRELGMYLMPRRLADAPRPFLTFPRADRKPLLRLASWSDGSRAFFDSRGLLHLISSDPSIPQISLVLYTDRIAAWTSNGLRCGLASFHPPASFTDETDAIHRLIKSFVARLS